MRRRDGRASGPAGKVSPVEETKARVAEAGVRVELARAQSELRTARQRLTSLWSNATPRFTRVDGQFDTPPAVPGTQAIEQRMAVSPNLKRAQMEVQRRKALVEVERAKRVPDVTVRVGAKRAEELGRNQVLLGVSVPLPFFDRNQGNLLEALKREDKSRDELLAVQVRLNTEVLQARERLSAGRSEIDALQREVLPGARSAYDAATTGFEFGKFNFLEVLDAQRTYFQAKSQYLKALAAGSVGKLAVVALVQGEGAVGAEDIVGGKRNRVLPLHGSRADHRQCGDQ